MDWGRVVQWLQHCLICMLVLFQKMVRQSSECRGSIIHLLCLCCYCGMLYTGKTSPTSSQLHKQLMIMAIRRNSSMWCPHHTYSIWSTVWSTCLQWKHLTLQDLATTLIQSQPPFLVSCIWLLQLLIAFCCAYTLFRPSCCWWISSCCVQFQLDSHIPSKHLSGI